MVISCADTCGASQKMTVNTVTLQESLHKTGGHHEFSSLCPGTRYFEPFHGWRLVSWEDVIPLCVHTLFHLVVAGGPPGHAPDRSGALILAPPNCRWIVSAHRQRARCNLNQAGPGSVREDAGCPPTRRLLRDMGNKFQFQVSVSLRLQQ
jgi:hypothetical protein